MPKIVTKPQILTKLLAKPYIRAVMVMSKPIIARVLERLNQETLLGRELKAADEWKALILLVETRGLDEYDVGVGPS